MLHLLTILGWLAAFGLLIHLIARALGRRLRGRKRRKTAFRKIREFRRHHHFDQKRRRWVRSADGMALIDEAMEDRWFALAGLGWLLLAFWEGYWVHEIIERFQNFNNPLQLPYVFLFFALVVIPMAIYLFFRRQKRRQLARLPVGVL